MSLNAVLGPVNVLFILPKFRHSTSFRQRHDYIVIIVIDNPGDLTAYSSCGLFSGLDQSSGRTLCVSLSHIRLNYPTEKLAEYSTLLSVLFFFLSFVEEQEILELVT